MHLGRECEENGSARIERSSVERPNAILLYAKEVVKRSQRFVFVVRQSRLSYWGKGKERMSEENEAF